MAAEFTCVEGMWISENFEPVQIQFEWQRSQQLGFGTDRICTEALASWLIDVLFRADTVEAHWNPAWIESSWRSASTRLPN